MNNFPTTIFTVIGEIDYKNDINTLYKCIV